MKKQINELTEALLVAMSDVKDDEGRHIPLRFNDNAFQNINLARQVAEVLISDGWRKEPK